MKLFHLTFITLLFFFISCDKSEEKDFYKIDLEKKSEPSASELNGHAMMANFSVSSNFLMLTYYLFEENPFK